jgi:hypothetical protein
MYGAGRVQPTWHNSYHNFGKTQSFSCSIQLMFLRCRRRRQHKILQGIFEQKRTHTYLHMAQFSKHSCPTRKGLSWLRPDNMTWCICHFGKKYCAPSRSSESSLECRSWSAEGEHRTSRTRFIQSPTHMIVVPLILGTCIICSSFRLDLVQQTLVSSFVSWKKRTVLIRVFFPPAFGSSNLEDGGKTYEDYYALYTKIRTSISTL